MNFPFTSSHSFIIDMKCDTKLQQQKNVHLTGKLMAIIRYVLEKVAAIGSVEFIRQIQ